MHAICLVARFQANTKENHVKVVKIIFRYLNSTLDYGLWYPKYSEFDLSAYIDVDWDGCVDDRRIASGVSLFLGSRLISWHSKKQDSLSLYTAEAEYIIATSCCTQVLWMKQTLKDIKIKYNEPI